jgi:asparaginyl-tRNA synthetase
MKWRSIKQSFEGKLRGESVSSLGRIKGIRKHKNRVFADLTDYTGNIQLVVDKSNHPFEYDLLCKANKGSYISVNGIYENDPRGNPEINVAGLEVIAEANLNVESPFDFNGSDPSHGDKVFSFPEIYVSNPQRAAILKIKTDFVRTLHEYFQTDGFTLVEPPVITDKTLYGKDNAIEAEVHGEKVFLSQCATFELEPLALAFGKVYTISPAFRNEPSGSKRHLAEYTHAKAEALFADISDLKELSGNSIYYAMRKVQELDKRELELLDVTLDIEGLKPENHEHISYNKALKITQKKGSTTEWGEGLKRRDEIILTEQFGNKYVWVNFPPFCSEGFPYRRLPEDKRLSMTCDLIAPHGAGEMVGVAEKITNSEELIENLIEKGQKHNIRHYWNYIALRQQGLPPHGGIGAAPERILYGLLGLDHIRLTKPWPRYPDRKIVTPENNSLNTYGSEELEKLVQKYDLK